MNDLRYALRQLGRRPGFSAIAIATVALAIGINTAIFSVVHGVLLRPLPFPQSDRLVTVWLTYPQWQDREILSRLWDHIPLAYPEYERLRNGTTSFEAVTIYRDDRMALTGIDRPQIVTVGAVDDALPAVLGTGPVVGRWFTAAEASRRSASRVTVLTHAFWRTHLGGDTAVIGRTIRLDDGAFVVVGILPEGMRFGRPTAADAPELWIPIGALDRSFDAGDHAFHAVARLRPTVPLERAQDETATLLRGDASPEARGARVLSRKEQEVAGVRPVLLVLWGAVSVILLIACVNVANLLLGRAAEREPEMAIRHALGAGRGRLARQLLVESMALAVIGGAAGVLLAWWGTGALVAFLPSDLPRASEIRVDLPVLAFSVVATLATGLLFGTLPSLMAGARAAHERLHAGTHRIISGGRLQRGLVAVQVALALVLLVGAGLLGRSLAELWAVDPGFRRDGLLTFQIALPSARYDTPASTDALFARLDAALAALPGVTHVATTSIVPLSGASASNSVWPASYGPEEGAKPEVERRVVSPRYLQDLGVVHTRGRPFTEADDATAEPVMLVSQAAVTRLWEGRDPIGDRVAMSSRWWTVIGVVGDVRDQLLELPPAPTVYVSFAQWPLSVRNFVLRTDVPPLTLTSRVRDVVRALDPGLPVTDMRSMRQVAADAVAAERFRAFLVGSLAVIASLLAAIGLYGVMSHGVARRTREIGIRMALGAARTRLVQLIVIQAGATVAVGVLAGVLLTVPAARVLRAFLFEVPTYDPLTYLGTISLLALVGLAAAYAPARRATRVEPMEALRHE